MALRPHADCKHAAYPCFSCFLGGEFLLLFVYLLLFHSFPLFFSPTRRFPALIPHTYSNISAPGARAAATESSGYGLSVDLSSAGCRSEEQHWQAEHKISSQRRGCAFSEVDERTGSLAAGERRACVCA